MIKSLALLSALAAALYTTLTDAGEAGDYAGVPAVSLVLSGAARPARRPHAPGISEYRVVSGGIERRYLMYVPESYDGRSALPVVFDFHGSGSDPREELEVSGMDRAAERRGLLLLMPAAELDSPGGGKTWNVPPVAGLPSDVRFALDVLEDAAGRVRLDETRVYATGFSGGARLASELACRAPDRIAAVGAVGGLRAPTGCREQPLPVVAFHGTGDPINPYTGGGAEYWGYGIDAAVHGWLLRNGCARVPARARVAPGVTEISYAGCAENADFVLYRIEGGGHVWPGSRYPFPRERFGRSVAELDATAVMLDFFAGRAIAADRADGKRSRQ
ncbi:MAG TPA: PHB depolymerase family esterase [Arenicellales bacterium]|nr:PHB depolymerase family esterase [Arenicellales bacterium]